MADLQPSNYNDLSPFRFWCQKVLPLVYDDSLSYYELLCKVVDHINQLINNNNLLTEDMQKLYDAYNTFTSYVENYLKNLDVQPEIDNKLDRMAASGELGQLLEPFLLDIIPPEFVTSVSMMTNKSKLYVLQSDGHIYQWAQNGRGWMDTGIAYGGTLTNIYQYLSYNNGDANLVAPLTFYFISNPLQVSNLPSSRPGILFANGASAGAQTQEYTEFLSNKKYYRTKSYGSTTWSEWEHTDMQYLNLINESTNLNNLEPQTIYWVTGMPANVPSSETGLIYTIGEDNENKVQYYCTSNSSIIFYRRCLNNVWGSWINLVESQTSNAIKYMGSLNPELSINGVRTQTFYFISSPDIPDIPVAQTGILTTEGSNTGARIQTFISYSTGKRYQRTKLNSNSSYTTWIDLSTNFLEYYGNFPSNSSLNDALSMSTYIVPEDSTISNRPDTRTGWLITLGLSEVFNIQYYIVNSNSTIYYRRKTSNTSYGIWNLLFTPNVSIAQNPNTYWQSVGNSILTGSVWKNGSYSNLSAYYNSPYSVMANACAIPKANVSHHLMSDTGFMTPPSTGTMSFLDYIKTQDLSSFDILVTHFYTNDMSTPIGTINSSAGDGTLAGGVQELLSYINSNNKQLQLCIIGIPPVSYSIKNENVFTGTYPNGSSIHDLNILLKEMSEKYHFIFIDWEDLNLSYFYQDYTDGNNVHANNEKTYRIMGSYLAGRLSSKFNA